MKANEYQKLAMRTNDGLCSQRLYQCMPQAEPFQMVDIGEIINASLGLSGEIGELNDMIKKSVFHGHFVDGEDIKKEIGDICWYVALMCKGFGFDLEEILQMNIDKLKKRYPEGFSEQASINRTE